MKTGDFNIDINSSGVEKDKLEEFRNLFDLTNLIHANTCYTKNHKSAADLILTNRYFKKVIDNGIVKFIKQFSTNKSCHKQNYAH